MGTRTYLFFLPEFSARSPPRDHKTPNNPARSRPPLWRFGVAWPLFVETHGSLCASFALPTLSQTWLLTPEGPSTQELFFHGLLIYSACFALSGRFCARVFPVGLQSFGTTTELGRLLDGRIFSCEVIVTRDFTLFGTRVTVPGKPTAQSSGFLVFFLLCELRIGHFPFAEIGQKWCPSQVGLRRRQEVAHARAEILCKSGWDARNWCGNYWKCCWIVQSRMKFKLWQMSSLFSV